MGKKAVAQHVANRRLLKLADFLERLDKSKFDLDIIARTNREGELPIQATYGSAACAIGWTPAVFPRNCEYKPKGNSFFGNLIVRKKNGLKTDFAFAEEFFNISHEEACFLFVPTRYPHGKRGKMSVAKRIREFVAAKPSQEELDRRYW